MSRDNISCIILAGGQGKRMGGIDKGLQCYQDKRLIDHTIENIAPQVDDIVISANRNIEVYEKLGYQVVSDDNNNFNGPLAGIASSIPHCKHEWILVIPCDMPALPDKLVSALLQHTNHSSLIIVNSDNKYQLILMMNRRMHASIAECLENNQFTVMRWVDSVDHHTLIIDNDAYLHNINTARDLDT